MTDASSGNTDPNSGDRSPYDPAAKPDPAAGDPPQPDAADSAAGAQYELDPASAPPDPQVADEPPAESTRQLPVAAPEKKSNVGLIVGAIAAVVLVGVAVAVGITQPWNADETGNTSDGDETAEGEAPADDEAAGDGASDDSSSPPDDEAALDDAGMTASEVSQRFVDSMKNHDVDGMLGDMCSEMHDQSSDDMKNQDWDAVWEVIDNSEFTLLKEEVAEDGQTASVYWQITGDMDEGEEDAPMEMKKEDGAWKVCD
ncbi:MAG: hypothetical protein ACRDXX_20220 [Stackebrandtia sp.]